MPRITQLLACLIVLFVPSSGHAVFHIAHISELMSGAGGNPSVEYVEIRMDADTQNSVGNTRLTTFSCDGTTVTVVLLVPNAVPNSGNGLHWIMASPSTAAFLAASGISPDFTWDSTTPGNAIPTPCGQVCWGAPGIAAPDPTTWSASDPNQYVDCVAYGGYTGPTKTADPDPDGVISSDGTPTTLLPGDGTLSLTRMTSTNNNVADFALACPTPTNNNGDMGGFGPCTPPTLPTTTTTTVVTASTTSTTVPGPSQVPGPPRRSRCTSRKLQAAGRKAAAKAGCAAAAVAKGASVKAGCTARAEAAFGRAWTKAEARKDCLAPTGDRAAIEGSVDAFLGRLAAALESGSQRSKCTSRKLGAAGAKAAARAACNVRAFAKGIAVDTSCVTNAGTKFTAAWARAEKRGDCQAATGDAARIEDEVDAFAAELVTALAP